MTNTSGPAGDVAHLIANLMSQLDQLQDAESLRRGIRWVIEQALRREQDRSHLNQTQAIIDQFFKTQSDADLTKIRAFCQQVLALAMMSRQSRAEDAVGVRIPVSPGPSPASEIGESQGEVPLPYPTRHDDFSELLGAALVYRIRHLTTFFQRRNPRIRRAALPPFLLSPDFDARFETVVVEQIAPAMMRNPRFTGALEHGRQWRRTNTEEFWAIVREGEGLEDRLLATWMEVWREFKPRRDDKNGKMMVPAGLAQIRKTLACEEPPSYTIPKIGGDQINLFMRLLSDLRPELDRHWAVLSDIYDQEIEHPRHGDGHRDGATLDAMTALFPALPGRLGEFVAILCHYNMPGIDTGFLRKVAASSAGTIFLSAFLGIDVEEKNTHKKSS
jgi:hypothetical protein